MAEPIMRVENVCFTRNELRLPDSGSFDVKDLEINCIIGANGAGNPLHAFGNDFCAGCLGDTNRCWIIAPGD